MDWVRRDLEHPTDGRPPIRDRRVLEALRAVPRHLFVPEGQRHRAYADGPLPIGHGQTISQPYIVALMTEALAPKPEDVVLEVGTGSGYQAAVLSALVSQVYSVEIVEALAQQAARALVDAGCSNVMVRHDDGHTGWPEHGPYDGIIVTAAPDRVPPPLIDQLAIGGRLVIPIGPPSGVQELMRFQKRDDGTLDATELLPVRFVPFTGDATGYPAPR